MWNNRFTVKITTVQVVEVQAPDDQAAERGALRWDGRVLPYGPVLSAGPVTTTVAIVRRQVVPEPEPGVTEMAEEVASQPAKKRKGGRR